VAPSRGKAVHSDTGKELPGGSVRSVSLPGWAVSIHLPAVEEPDYPTLRGSVGPVGRTGATNGKENHPGPGQRFIVHIQAFTSRTGGTARMDPSILVADVHVGAAESNRKRLGASEGRLLFADVDQGPETIPRSGHQAA